MCDAGVRFFFVVSGFSLLLASAMASSGASGSGSPALPASSARRMDPWAIPFVAPVTDTEIDSYNQAITDNEVFIAEQERKRQQTLLAKLKMPEDI